MTNRKNPRNGDVATADKRNWRVRGRMHWNWYRKLHRRAMKRERQQAQRDVERVLMMMESSLGADDPVSDIALFQEK